MTITFRDPENKYIKEYPKEFHFTNFTRTIVCDTQTRLSRTFLC